MNLLITKPLVSSAPRTKFGLAMKPSRELSRIEQINNSPCPVAFWHCAVQKGRQKAFRLFFFDRKSKGWTGKLASTACQR